MKVKYLEKFYVAGITVKTNNKIELDETTAQIPKLWERYVDENIESKTFNKSPKPTPTRTDCSSKAAAARLSSPLAC